MFDFYYHFWHPSVRQICQEGLQAPYMTIAHGSFFAHGHFETYYENGHILIGRYCSIAHDVHLLFAMNHDYRKVTTYGYASEPFIRHLKISAPPPEKIFIEITESTRSKS